MVIIYLQHPFTWLCFFFFSFKIHSSKEIPKRYKKVPRKIRCLLIQLPHTHISLDSHSLFFSFSIFSEIILSSILFFIIRLSIASLALQLLYFFFHWSSLLMYIESLLWQQRVQLYFLRVVAVVDIVVQAPSNCILFGISYPAIQC